MLTLVYCGSQAGLPTVNTSGLPDGACLLWLTDWLAILPLFTIADSSACQVAMALVTMACKSVSEVALVYPGSQTGLLGGPWAAGR